MVVSQFGGDGGKRERTVDGYLGVFRQFMDWADANGRSSCLAGGDVVREAYQLFARDVEDRFARHEIQSAAANKLQVDVLTVLEAFSGLQDLGRGIRFVQNTSWKSGGTEPINLHDFAHALALNSSLFFGLSELAIDKKPFPFKLSMPKSLGWGKDYLWVFPSPKWSMPPHQLGEARVSLKRAFWVYDYEQGKVASIEELLLRDSRIEGRSRESARLTIENAKLGIESANANARNHFRRMLAMTAHNAFYFMFLANTSANDAPVSEIETDGKLNHSTSNAGFRSTKWRAHGKSISVVVPVSLMPALHRFMELRNYLLNGEEFPYLFLSLGGGERDSLGQVKPNCLAYQYESLRRIDPLLPKMGVHKIRATALSYYRQKHDASIAALVAQHTEKTSNTSYDAGTEADHHVELSLLMEKIVEKAEQRIVAKGAMSADAKPLEDGGVCQSYGQPEAIGEDVPVMPNCKTGCLFCTKRVLIAGEEDTRKLASASFLMEQLIMGPMGEAEFRPQIIKCDDDLAKIRAFDGCADMVERVKKDVFENGNLTTYFSDKYQLFLSLGVL